MNASDSTSGSSRQVIVLVTPWYGREHRGGAESLAWELSHRLQGRGLQVEVYATASRAFLKDWYHDQIATGTTVEDGVTVRRFAVDPRNSQAFDLANGNLMTASRGVMLPDVTPVATADADDFFNHSINSSALIAELSARASGIRAVIAMPYLYGVVLRACQVMPERTLFHTCLHDESYAYTQLVGKVMRQVARLVYLSSGERSLALRLYGPGVMARSMLVGSGIPEPPPHPAAVAQVSPDLAKALDGRPYLLYLGRRDDTKGVGQLAEVFRGWRHRERSDWHLVIAGPGQNSYDDPISGIHDVGLVSEELKWSLIDGCTALVNPSRNESYSRVLMEAWRRDKPVVAHLACLATAMAVQDSGGGWLADDPGSWEVAFSTISAASQAERLDIGRRGRTYSLESSNWDRVLDRFEGAIADLDRPSLESPLAKFVDRHECSAQTWIPDPPKLYARQAGRHGIHQLLPALAFGDAIGNQALTLRELIRSKGHDSEIFVEFLDEKIRDQAFHLKDVPDLIRPGDGIIYHHSIGSGSTPIAVGHPGPKVLVYHNITPARFFRGYRPQLAALLEKGRAELPALASSFPITVSDSSYNAKELLAAGYRHAGVLPLPIDPSTWRMPADDPMMRRLCDGRLNVLFVGRGAPNKRQDDLLRAFSLLHHARPEVRLVLAGEFQPNDPYHDRCRQLAEPLGDSVVFTGKLGMAALQACYRTAHVFVSLSEHEGFGVPLIEAMWFDVPVLAYACTAVPEALDGAGLLLLDKDDPATVAATISLVLDDQSLRSALVAAGRLRRGAFDLTAITTAFEREVLQHLLPVQVPRTA